MRLLTDGKGRFPDMTQLEAMAASLAERWQASLILQQRVMELERELAEVKKELEESRVSRSS